MTGSPSKAGAPGHHRDSRRRERLFLTGTAAAGAGTAPAAGRPAPGRVPDAAALSLLHPRHARRSVRSGYRGRSGRYGRSGQPGLPDLPGSRILRENGTGEAERTKPSPAARHAAHGPGLQHIGPARAARGGHTRAGHCGDVPSGAVRHMRRSSARWRTNGLIRNGYQASTAVLTCPVAMVYTWPETLTFIVLVKQCTSRLRGNAGSQGVLLTGHGVTAAAGTQPTTDRKS